MTIVRTNWKLIIGIVLVIVVVSSYLFSDTAGQTSAIPSLLEKANEELFAENSKLDSKVQDLKVQAENLQGIINQKDQQIYHLKTVLDEKINRINNYSIDELQQFFAKFTADSIPH